MKKLLLVLLSVMMIFALAGCGKEEGDEFVGTWKYMKEGGNGEYYYVIEKTEGKGYIARFVLVHDNWKFLPDSKPLNNIEYNLFAMTYADGKLADGKGRVLAFTDKDKKVIMDHKYTYKKISDKSLTYKEIDNGRGLPCSQELW